MELAEDGGLFDVTRFVQDMKSQNTRIERLLKAQAVDNKRTRALVVQVLETQVATTGPMAKAVQELLTMLGDVPEQALRLGGHLPSRRALARHGVEKHKKPEHAATGFLGGNQLTERRVLAKAVNKSVIDENVLRRFNLTRAFDDDADRSNEIRLQVETLLTA
jgi:hypothetical protein